MKRRRSCTAGQFLLFSQSQWLAKGRPCWRSFITTDGRRRKIPPKAQRRGARRRRQSSLDLPGIRPMVQLPLSGLGRSPVRLICLTVEGRLRVRVLGDPKGLFVYFPPGLRTEGAVYEVDEVRPAMRGKYWRPIGTPRRVNVPFDQRHASTAWSSLPGGAP